MEVRIERRLLVLVTLSMVFPAIALNVASVAERFEFRAMVDGVERSAVMRIPAHARTQPTPVVFVFHGHGGTATFTERKYPVSDLWPEALAIYPQGLPTKTRNDPEGRKPGWQINPATYGDRDLKFFDALMRDVQNRARIDANRIFAMGHSNGARFVYVLWAERPKTFAAVAAMAAPGTGLINRLEPISAFILAGEKDRIVDFRGQQLSLALLKANYSFDNKSPEKKVGYATYRRADNGSTFVSYIHPGGHEVPKDAVHRFVQFFKSESRR